MAIGSIEVKLPDVGSGTTTTTLGAVAPSQNANEWMVGGANEGGVIGVAAGAGFGGLVHLVETTAPVTGRSFVAAVLRNGLRGGIAGTALGLAVGAANAVVPGRASVGQQVGVGALGGGAAALGIASFGAARGVLPAFHPVAAGVVGALAGTAVVAKRLAEASERDAGPGRRDVHLPLGVRLSLT